MASEDNSVNIGAQRYHHGDLRAATLAVALERLRMQNKPDLRLRALARELGVSATALYRHFPSKRALLEAIAQEGIARLGAHQARAARRAAPGREAFLATGKAYVEWACANPALFRLTFAHLAPPDFDRDSPLNKASGERRALGDAARHLLQGIESVLPQIPSSRRAVAAQHAWSLVHGLAHLVLDRQIDNDPDRIEAIVAMTFGIALSG